MRGRRILCISMLVIMSVTLFSGCGSQKLNLNDYLEYEVSGSDGECSTGTGLGHPFL
jgi:hypothetical protein